MLGIPNPAASRVRSPSWRRLTWYPDWSICIEVAPPPIRIKLVETIHAKRYIPSAQSVEQSISPAIIPTIPAIKLRSRIQNQRLCVREYKFFTGVNLNWLFFFKAGDACAFSSDDEGCKLWFDIDAVITGTFNNERRLGCINFNSVPWQELTNIYRTLSGCKPYLQEVRLDAADP
jgi:hypothetical protein